MKRLLLCVFLLAIPLFAEEPVTLQQLEQMALQNNPTIAQAMAAVKAAEGRKSQAGVYPNPIVGIQMEELSQRDPQGRNDEHIFFTAEQTILLGGKRGKGKEVFEKEKITAQTGVEMQTQRVLNAVRLLYYRTLGAQEQLEVRKKQAALSEEAANITHELFNVGQADQPDVLEAEIEAQTAQLAALSAESELRRNWRQLAAVTGKPDLSQTPLAGTLDDAVPEITEKESLAKLINESPQIKAAQLEFERTQSAIRFQKSQRIPDLRVRGGIGYNYELLQTLDKPVGLEGFFEVAIPLPLFNKNQGNIALAVAEADRAGKELERLKLVLASRFAEIYSEYERAKTLTAKYESEALPRARTAYELYLQSFQKMAAAYPQVLIAQRNRYQLEVEYTAARTEAWTAALQLQGFLLSEGALDAPSAGVRLQ